MESEHIETRKLYDAVAGQAVLDQSEIEHLGTCEECLELIRLLVRQRAQLPKQTGQ